MIEVNIVGQLGNQLFEYACARQLQEKYGGKIYLNTYEMRQNTPNFRLALLDFNLNENVEVVSERPLKEANALYRAAKKEELTAARPFPSMVGTNFCRIPSYSILLSYSAPLT